MKQLFSIGEVVIRQAQNYPEGNGEYTITSIITKEEYNQKYPAPFGWNHLDEFYYGLEGFSLEIKNAKGASTKIITHHTAQSNLRKRHERGDMGYLELITHLNTKIVERI